MPRTVAQDARSLHLKPQAEAAEALLRVQRAIVSCERCPRLRAFCQRIAVEKRRAYRDETYWARPVPGFGDANAQLVIIGLAPAAHGANRTGRVFTGDGVGGSGDFLMTALHANGFATLPTSHRVDDGLTLLDAYIAAAVRCAPPDNRPTPDEIDSCLPHLADELAALPNLKTVVTLGGIAHAAYLRLVAAAGVSMRPKPKFAHGARHALANGVTLFGSYHPSRQNTNTGRLTATMLAEVFAAARRSLDTSSAVPDGTRRSPDAAAE